MENSDLLSQGNDELPVIDFSDKKYDQRLIAVYNALNQEKLDYVDRKWETIKTTTYITIGIIAGTGAISTAFENSDTLKLAFGILLFIIGPVINIWSFLNIRRESKLQFFSEFSTYQIEKLWDLHNPIKENKNWLPKYPYIFERKHREYQFNSTVRLDKYKNNPPLEWAKGRVRNQEFLIYELVLNLMCCIGSLVFGFILICG